MRSFPRVPASSLALLGFILLAANLLWLPAFLTARIGDGAALGIHAALRFLIVLSLALGWVTLSGLRRSQALWGAGFIILAEQFFLKGGSLLYDAMINPEGWVGASASGIIFGLLMGTVVFLPVVLIVAWLGTEFGAILLARKKQAS